MDITARLGRMFTFFGKRGFHQHTVTIQAATEGQDATGGVTQTWADVTGLVGLACVPWWDKGTEQRVKDGIFTLADFRLLIPGAPAGLTEKQRAIVNHPEAGLVTYTIMLVDRDALNSSVVLHLQLLK